MKMQKIKTAIKQMFPNSWVDREINGFLRFGLNDVRISNVLTLLHESSIEDIRQNWGLTDSSLEDVFLQVIKIFQDMDAKQSLLTDNVIWSDNQKNDNLKQSVQIVDDE